MKKIGIFIFAIAILLGVFVSSFFSFGRVTAKVFNFSFGSSVKGSGKVATETRDIEGFNGVDVSGVFQVEITARKDFAIEIEADDNLLSLIRTEVRGGVLRIDTREKIKSGNPLKIRISAPNIDSVDASGVSRVTLANVKNDDLRVDAGGASKVSINGETANLTIEVSGASEIDAENLKAENANVDASGASYVRVFATGELKSDASGASKIVYSGGPKNVEKKSFGASSVREK